MHYTKRLNRENRILENGWNVLSSIDVDTILRTVKRKQTCLQYPQPRLFGDGNAAERICKEIIKEGN